MFYKHSPWLFPLILLVASFLLYIQTFSGQWLMDDIPVVVNNPDIRSIAAFMKNSFPGRPLREITFLLDYSLFGLESWGYHIQNVLWHTLNCWLVYVMALRLKCEKPVAVVAALLFLAHPVHVEVVANTSHRKDSLALAFILMALLAYMRLFDSSKLLMRMLWFGGSIVLWVIAFFAKGNSLVFPILALSYEYLLVPEENRFIIRRRWFVPVLVTVLIVGSFAWFYYIWSLPSFKIAIIGAFVKMADFADFSMTAYALMVLKSAAFMFSKLVYPSGLSMEYIYSVPKSIFDPWVIAAVALLTALCASAFYFYRKYPAGLYLLIFSAALWVPTANIFWHSSYFAADRYLYAPSAGICILISAITIQSRVGMYRYVRSGWLVLLIVCSVLSWQQSTVWLNAVNLYSHMLEVSPRSLEAMVGLAHTYFSKKQYAVSAGYARLAVERDFTDYRPYLLLGSIRVAEGNAPEALRLLLEAQKYNRQAPEVYGALGTVYDELGKFPEAIDSFNEALKLRQDDFSIYTNLGVTYERMHMLKEAEAALKKALEINSSHVSAWYNLGIVRYRNNDKAGARSAFSEVVSRDNSHGDALTNLSVVCKELGDENCYHDAVRKLSLIHRNVESRGTR